MRSGTGGNAIEPVTTAALGDTSYLLTSGDEALVVDPQRDCWPLLASCEARGLRIRYVLDTHVHNDYLSGALEVRAATGATVAGPARAGYDFDHLPLAEGDEITLGGLCVQALETPGHTAEHTAYLVLDGGSGEELPTAVFTGGSLLVGSAGRTDLSGAARTEQLARAQYRSLRRLAQLPSGTRVLPTHGAGSSCSIGAVTGERTSTVGDQRLANPALLIADEDAFVATRMLGLPPAPAYYRQMGPLNRAGPAVLGGPPELLALTPQEVQLALGRGALVVDARDRRAFADAHLPGSLGDELDGSFAALVGEVVPLDRPLVLVLPEPVADAAREAVLQLLRIGYDARLVGQLDGGVERWRASGRPLAAIRTADVSEVRRALAGGGVASPALARPAVAGPAVAGGAVAGGAAGPQGGLPVQVLDVRPAADPPVPGALAIPLTELPGRIDGLPPGREFWTVCGRGRRATVAASLLAAAGLPVTAVVSGGAQDLVREFRR
ncbi:MBL fold metallo-hydrolase [Kitasatospora sp. RG8]|uniref:MBL fold metallo-hydrolase n=1 Tax=Kitasatospora sp. RG8 TaxID=2820815 RepID=UPI001ADF9715|nr:MBL fold metallo-hydrolase [Kitasatospora sp. RG8]MBP0448777.1 MBL fold metallo-hydrolase [Kitasatospora sp. RG8]